MSSQKRSFTQRFHAWLDEPEGQIFTRGKWKFWWPVVTGFTMLNALLTAVIFRDGGQLENYMGAVLIGVGGLLAWICVGALHYSDSRDRRLARGVSALDSITLVFVAAHFSFLLWTYGHLRTLQTAERDYKVEVEKYNAAAREIQTGNEKIAESARQIAEIQKQTERLRNDTAYWSKKNGVKPVQSGIQFQWTPAKVELAPPPKAPADSSADFLARWDAWVRVLNCGELLLAIATLIFIRNRSAAVNTPAQPRDDQGETWPDEIETGEIEKRSPKKRADFAITLANNARRSSSVLGPKGAKEKTRGDRMTGLEALRAALSDISFYHPGVSFKADLKPDFPREPDHVRIRAMRANRGTQETIASTKAALSILDDARTMKPGAFRERLEAFLKKRGFEL